MWLKLAAKRCAKVLKNELRPWKKQRYCIPEADAARVIAQMGGVLDIYTAEYGEEEPLTAMDEAALELTADVYAPWRCIQAPMPRKTTIVIAVVAARFSCLSIRFGAGGKSSITSIGLA